MVEYLADRQEYLRSNRTPKKPNLRKIPSREEWSATAMHYELFSPFLIDYEDNKAEFADVMVHAEQHFRRLRKLYEFGDDAAVEAFLEEKPFLIRLLFNAHRKIREYFPVSRLVLKVIADPEAQEERELFLFIQTKLHPRAARPLLAELDREWWLDAMLDANGEMNISLQYVRDER